MGAGSGVTRTVAVIPARWASVRFPGKALVVIRGKPLVQHVWERARELETVERVVVATDDERIAAAVRGFGGAVVMTGADCVNGTDRVAQATRDWPVDLVVVGTDTFDRIASSAVPARFGRAVCPVAGVNDLLAMKFHALRYVPSRVAYKFFADVHALVRRAGGRVTDPAVRDLCLKYGSQEIYDRLAGTADPL